MFPSLFRHPNLLLLAMRYPRLFSLGWREARCSNGLTFDNDPWGSRSRAYDAGRDLRLWGRS